MLQNYSSPDNVVNIKELLDKVKSEMVVNLLESPRKEAEDDFKRIPSTDNKMKCIVNVAWQVDDGDFEPVVEVIKGELVEGQNDLEKSMKEQWSRHC